MGGQAEGCALDCLSGVAKVLHNDERKFWVMKHGLCLPASRGGVARASEQVRYSEKHKQPGDLTLAETIAQSLRVGVHWDTEVQSGGHPVCQVLCSALPVGLLKDARASDYAPLAIALLNGAFEAVLLVAAILAAQRGTRVKVHLTLLGAGALGNRKAWIAGALEQALSVYREEPLDVTLVHYRKVSGDVFKEMEFGREPASIQMQMKNFTQDVNAGAAQEQADALKEQLQELRDQITSRGATSVPVSKLEHVYKAFDQDHDGRIDLEELSAIDAWANTQEGVVIKSFSNFDVNGDGVIDKNEFLVILQEISPSLFNQATVDILIDEADADGDGEIHYAEFFAWLFGTDPFVVQRILSSAKLYDGID